MKRFVLALAAALTLAACGGKAPVDAMDSARRALEDTGEAEPCAEAEFAAARNLLAQAEEAYANRDYARARQFADAAQAQAQYAREVAAANAEDCERLRAVTETAEVTRDARDIGEPVETDYEFSPIHFEYDASTLSADAQRTLDGHARQLNANPEWRIQVDGHCDTRGTTQYNLALGDRRARAVKDYLVRMGVAPERITTVSFGAEVPVSGDHARNRRAEFRVRR